MFYVQLEFIIVFFVCGIDISKTDNILQGLIPKADITLQILAEQVSNDIAAYISDVILPDVNHPKNLIWRDMRALMSISIFPEGITPAMLSRYTRYDPATILRVYDQLADCDFVYQLTNPDDARSLIIKITNIGQDFLTRFFNQYHCQQSQIIPTLLPRYTEDELIDTYQACFFMQEHAERLASITARGKVKFQNVGQYSLAQFNKNFEFYSAFPEFALHLICKNIAEDYIKFLNTHVIKKMLKGKKIKIRELRVLMCLEHLKVPTAPSRIAKIMRMDPATVSRAIKVLTSEGYIDVFDDMHDDRAKLLWIKKLGVELCDEYKSRVDDALAFAQRVSGNSLSDLRKEEMLTTLLSLRERSSVFVTSNRCRGCRAA